MKNVFVTKLPPQLQSDCVYSITPHTKSDTHYFERTNRNIGWITHKEQSLLRDKVVGIAGCGGMGGHIAAFLLRLGVGEIRIADPEIFDVSNLNRQMAAKHDTIAVSKAWATATELRTIADDTTIVVYPQGITSNTVDQFLHGCDTACDMIEYFAVGSRLQLHASAKAHNVPLFNFNTVGHRTYGFFFDHNGQSLEEAFGFTLRRAQALQERVQSKTNTHAELMEIITAVNSVFLPIIPNYSAVTAYNMRTAFLKRIIDEQKASIIATNPPMAAGAACNRVLLHLLAHSDTPREITPHPPFPSYMLFDAATWQAEIVQRTHCAQSNSTL